MYEKEAKIGDMMNTEKHIGINGLFLRKSGSGIGVVTKFFVESLATSGMQESEYTLYIDTPDTTFPVGETGKLVYIKPLWTRDDLIRKILWEHIQLPKRALKDGITHFLSLYQAPTEFPKHIRHSMLVHDIIPEIFPEYRRNSRTRLLWNLTKRGIAKATKVVAVSQSTKNDIVKHLGVAEEKIVVAHPSINPLFFQEDNIDVLAKYDLSSGYLYHGGGLEIRKNTESVLTAYAAWIQNASTTVPPLVISGHVHESDNPLATDVHDLITELKLEERVRLLGFVPDEDLPGLYKEAALFIFPSLYEGFGMPVVEALSQGTAVVALKNSSLGEVGAESVYWVERLTKENLEMNYQRALQSSSEEKSARVLQAKNFQSWPAFTQKVLDTLLQ